jgi:hypothetical protein
MLVFRWRVRRFGFNAVRDNSNLSVFSTYLAPYVTSGAIAAHTDHGSRKPLVWTPLGDTVSWIFLWGHITQFSPDVATPLASPERLAKGVAKDSGVSSIAHILPTGSFSGQRIYMMSFNHLGFAAVVGGSVCILTGCQTTAQHAPPANLSPAPVLPTPPAF